MDLRKLAEEFASEQKTANTKKDVNLPGASAVAVTLRRIFSLMFPGCHGFRAVQCGDCIEDIEKQLSVIAKEIGSQIEQVLIYKRVEKAKQNGESLDESFGGCSVCSSGVAEAFMKKLPEIRRMLQEDIAAAYDGDPAATGFGEVICCYPGVKAVSNYRMAHRLLELGVPLIPRIISEIAHSETGIDIHPGACIGEYFTSDHGTGIVIGETCIIGNNVKLYQGVTLGAKSFPLDEKGNPIKGIPRHPILKDNVIVYANATILGRITVGKGAVIGGNIWVTDNVPDGGQIVQRK